MSKIRLKFSKMGMAKYISHLDLLRTFTRAIHRAELPVKYSQGFNPHQLITFSLPLSLGTTGESEFVDIDFEDGTDFLTVVKKLNESLPPDIKILEASAPAIKAKDIVSAEYVFDILSSGPVDKEKIEEFFAKSEIKASKKTKRGEKEINLKDFIHEYEVLEADDKKIKLRIILSAGGENNIKPQIVAEKLCEFIENLAPENAEIHRVKTFYQDGKKIKIFC